MQDESFFTKKIEEAEGLLQQLKVDLRALFTGGKIPSEKDKIDKLLEFQRHLREAKRPLDELFKVAVDARIAIEKELGM